MDEESLSLLECYLLHHSYLEGFQISDRDYRVYESIKSTKSQIDRKKYYSIARWLKQVEYFYPKSKFKPFNMGELKSVLNSLSETPELNSNVIILINML